MPSAIEIRGLTKRFGEYVALDAIDLDVPKGSVYGFLGRNGAGKTTTLRIVTGLAKPDSGQVRILGNMAGSASARRIVGFLPDVPGYYPWMRADEFLRFAGSLFGIDRSTLDERVGVLLDLAGLAGVRTKIGGFSRGMRQRLGVAQALVNAPDVLLLDEPTSALDPFGRREVLEMIGSLSGRTTVFFSTHILADVERVCDRVAILDEGRVVVEASIDELRNRHPRHRLQIEVGGDATALAAAIDLEDWATGVALDEGRTVVSFAAMDLDRAQRRVPVLVSEASLPLTRFGGTETSLEEVFVELVKEGQR